MRMRARLVAFLAITTLLLALPVAFGQPAAPVMGRLFALDFWDEQGGMGLAEVVGQEQVNVVKTADGGATFSVLYSLRREQVTEIATFGPQGKMGVILGTNAIFRTTNGG